jgi:hypothetical protein
MERRRHPARRACIASDDFRGTLAAYRLAKLVNRTLGSVDRHRSRDPAGRDHDSSQDIPGTFDQGVAAMLAAPTGGSPAQRRLGVGA